MALSANTFFLAFRPVLALNTAVVVAFTFFLASLPAADGFLAALVVSAYDAVLVSCLHLLLSTSEAREAANFVILTIVWFFGIDFVISVDVYLDSLPRSSYFFIHWIAIFIISDVEG